MSNEEYRKIEFEGGATLEECVNDLLFLKNHDIKAFGIFNGHKLFSDTVTMDNAYKEITGYTKEEYDKRIEEKANEYKKIQEDHEKQISTETQYWIEEGHKILDKSKWDYWDKIVPIRLDDLYHGMELGCCLKIIKILQNGTLEEAKREIDSQDHSGLSFSLVCSMVSEFSPRGQEFMEYVYN